MMKSKKLSHKQNVLKKPVMKKKLKMMLEAVKHSGSLTKLASKAVFPKKSTNTASTHVRSESDAFKTNKSDQRARGRQSAENIRRSVVSTPKSTDRNRSRSEDMGGAKKAGTSDHSCKLRASLSSAGDYKVAKEKQGGGVTRKTTGQNKKEGPVRLSKSLDRVHGMQSEVSLKTPTKSSFYDKKSNSSQRKSLSATLLNQTTKLRKRVSRSK
ncbi:hypothetical protein HHI36_021670 [Cryptolaemus montrouzieri]|uniref:Uncharacterized protein n=1 Tax=Cryptolaemus montrouzieri TaxID=559131 RepID=A0ABD2MXG4_9CUCU